MFWICCGIVVLLAFWAFLLEPNWYRLKKVTISGGSKIQKPFSILHLSDTHFHDRLGSKWKFFQKLSKLNPDFIFLTGDIIDSDQGIDLMIQCLSILRARHGIYMVLGNHDYYNYTFIDSLKYHLKIQKIAPQNNVKRLVEELEKIGVHVLINRSLKVNHGNSIVIAGTDDPVTQELDLVRTLSGVGTQTYNILLTHLLDSLSQVPLHHKIDLAFSGHTHGGQIRIPFFGAMMTETKLPRKYAEGVHQYGQTTVVVSRGLGANRSLFLRFACRPEAILVDVT